MPWNGSGVFTRVYSWVTDANSGIAILPDRMDVDTDDIAAGLEHCLTVNGETVPTGNFNLNNFRIFNAAPGIGTNDLVTVGQVNSGGGGVTGGGFVPISGGSMTGQLNVAASVDSTGANAGFQFNGRDGSANWLWYATGNAARLWTGGDKLSCDSSGNLSCTGNIYCPAIITAGTLSIGGNATIGGFLQVNGSSDVAGNLQVNSTLTAGSVHSTGSLQVDGNAQVNGQINANGPIFGYTLTGGYIHSTGTLQIDSNAQINGYVQAASVHSLGNMQVDGTFNSTGNIVTPNSVQGGYVHSTGSLQVDNIGQINGALGVSGNLNVAGTTGLQNVTLYQLNTAWDIVAGHYVYPNIDANWYCGLAAQAWLGVVSYNYYPASDLNKKRDVASVPSGSLGLVRDIEPKVFNWNIADEVESRRRHWGFIAQEVGAVMQAAGHNFGGHVVIDGHQHLGLVDMLAVLWAAVRELSAEVSAMKGV